RVPRERPAVRRGCRRADPDRLRHLMGAEPADAGLSRAQLGADLAETPERDAALAGRCRLADVVEVLPAELELGVRAEELRLGVAADELDADRRARLRLVEVGPPGRRLAPEAGGDLTAVGAGHVDLEAQVGVLGVRGEVGLDGVMGARPRGPPRPLPCRNA